MSGPTVERLPWPNVRGKRCLHVGAADDGLVAALERGGAAEVATIEIAELRDGVEQLGAERLGEGSAAKHDVVVCHGILAHVRDPLPVLLAVAGVTRGMLLSCEPVDLWLSVLARGRPLLRPTGAGADARFVFNGAGHKHLLVTAGFQVERAGRPFVVPDGTAANGDAGPARRAALWAVTGSTEDGALHRGLLARRVR